MLRRIGDDRDGRRRKAPSWGGYGGEGFSGFDGSRAWESGWYIGDDKRVGRRR